MIRTLQSVSGAAFYILGLMLFAGWMMIEWSINPTMGAMWLQGLDLPFAFSAIVYGGVNVYDSVRDDAAPSKILPWCIGVPLAILFLVILVLNFGA